MTYKVEKPLGLVLRKHFIEVILTMQFFTLQNSITITLCKYCKDKILQLTNFVVNLKSFPTFKENKVLRFTAVV
jgi:hypothetical protein